MSADSNILKLLSLRGCQALKAGPPTGLRSLREPIPSCENHTGSSSSFSLRSSEVAGRTARNPLQSTHLASVACIRTPRTGDIAMQEMGLLLQQHAVRFGRCGVRPQHGHHTDGYLALPSILVASAVIPYCAGPLIPFSSIIPSFSLLAPISSDTFSALRNRMNVGMARNPNLCAMGSHLSASIFTNMHSPAYFSDISSKNGVIILHGPHQEAQKSIQTCTLLLTCCLVSYPGQ